ncbi:general odorant-binding protein 72-like isoform X2 [Phlebotomus argentipes]|uniref:general odorant-binding protein 72-like isoform X2 n=1 Tax=Phlebotomus argentipes TaxID=94469 RepID=UPI0028937AB3|nr:general odorant-binding protein 72-like isoform X2 [Phlebotomus argentipes]
MLKLIILVIFLQSQIQQTFCQEDPMKQAAQLVRQSCQPKTKVTTEAIEGVNKRIFPDNDKSIKCYLNCVLEMGQTMKRGKVIYKQAVQQIKQFVPENQKESALYALDMCKDAPNGQKDPCEAAYTLAKCLLQHNPSGSFP